MLMPSNYTINNEILQEAIQSIPQIEFKLPLNEPTGDFFYDPWKIKPEFQGTIWEKVLNSLPEAKGEARLIELSPGTCYYAHADIDDRWHLSLQADLSFLVDINSQIMYRTEVDTIWYDFDTSEIHSAVNFSNRPRIQLVVRKLLNKNTLVESVPVTLTLKKYRSDFRYVFDHTISPWLNTANKQGWLCNFKQTETSVEFNIEKSKMQSLAELLPEEFELTCL